jgi:hypothetical protein
VKKALLLVCLVLPGSLYGQSTLNFPKVSAPSELLGTGFAVVNPNSSEVSATFTLLGTSGSIIATDTWPIPAGGQFAMVGTGLFPDASEAGWVQVTSTADGLTGFCLTGDFETFEDGADAAPASSDLVLPLVTATTGINVANTGVTVASVTLSLRDADGAELGSSTQSIESIGVFEAQASALFSGADLGQARHILITGGTSISAVAVITDFLVSPSIGVSTIYPTAAFSSTLGTLGGIVRTTGNVAVFGALVVAVDSNGQAVASQISDPNGAYSIPGLPAGSYTVYAEPMTPPFVPSDVFTLPVSYPGQAVNPNFTVRFR